MTVVPGGWTTGRLLDLVSIRSGQVDPKLPQYRGMPLIAPDHLEVGTGRLRAPSSAHEQGAISGKFLVDPGDVIYSKIRPYLMKAHRAQFSALCSADMYPLKPRVGVDGRYVVSLLLGERFTNFAVGESMRSGIPKVNREALAGYELAFPPSFEQRAIGEALGDVDDLGHALERLISKKRGIKQGVMHELLTGRTRLCGFADPWRTQTFGDILSYRQPIRYLVESSNYEESGTPVLTAGRSFVLGYTSERGGVYSDLPVIIFDDFTTDSKYIDFEFKVKSSAMKMLAAKAGVDLRWAFERMQIVDFIVADHKRRWISEYSKIEVEVPGRDEQEAIASVAADADAEIKALEERLESARAVKIGMMQELLTGRTRLPVKEDA
ncbi:MAG: restriction endonuclease subunit S [Leucobacter sp.]